MNNTCILNIILLVLLITFNDCSKKDSGIVTKKAIHNRYKYEKIFATDTFFLKIDSTQNKVIYTYTNKTESDTIYTFLTNSINDSTLYHYNIEIPLIETKNYTINGKSYSIKKYFFDEEKSQDEESSYYFNENYGLLVLYNNGWSSLISTTYYDSISYQLIDSILIDKTGFYKLPPPPKRKSMKTSTK